MWHLMGKSIYEYMFFNVFGRQIHKGHWDLCFGFLVTSPLVFKTLWVHLAYLKDHHVTIQKER